MSQDEEIVLIEKEVDTFIRHIDSLAGTLPLTLEVITAAQEKSQTQLSAFAKEHIEFNVPTEEGDEARAVINIERLMEFNRLVRQTRKSFIAGQVVPRSFVVSLVSQFDSFLGQLIKALFYHRPEKLAGSEKALTFAQLMEFNSIDKAKEHIIEKEVETVLRKSHADQFDWLERTFDIQLRKDLPSWSTFIEVTERRNLFVHANAVVTNQYLKICREHKVSLSEDLQVGDQLEVPPGYFDTAYRCIFEIGMKLAHVLWRKHASYQRKQADGNLISISYELLEEEQYELAQNILDFACETIKKHASENLRLRLVVNRAQAYKWNGNPEKALEIVNREDWTATSNLFKLAQAVLIGAFADAANLMVKLKDGNEIKKGDYRDWPLFKEFRCTEEFLLAYEQIFGDPFNKVEPPDDPKLLQ
jgi:hypothetical protein